ncbi:HpcH/HpaI aldolase/citrate lyase family protein [Novosphingobium sp. B-7]|uniref:HpcH/HpaI aldolase/citrate lyase family protein n=1 Tax=Novosphingobium sp. B-7 TaxID=1298855 RepID=UPI0003B60528|nr:HpcH/HpaI aldolase/citrate lyase family protein [Novosphingobium sp. B-7]
MNAIALGATLYIPVLRPNLLDICLGGSPDLRSIVVCLEDSISEDELDAARVRFASFLLTLTTITSRLTIYVRPRDFGMLVWMAGLPGIHAVDGFVLPKVEASNVAHWLSIMLGNNHAFMPTIEGIDAFDRAALAQLCKQLLPLRERVTAIRIGGNDILNILGVRRSKHRTAYEGPLGAVIRDIAGTFIPAGFAVAAPVFEHYASLDLLREEVEQDIEHGLFTKTAIHPCQIGMIHGCYQPSPCELLEAQAILEADARAVFGSRGSMCEPATHRRWAGNVIARARAFGVAASDLIPAIRVA